MNNLFAQLFPPWVPWLGLTLNLLLLLVIASCMVASPWEAWARRGQPSSERQVNDLKRFQKIEADLLVAPVKPGRRKDG